MKAKRYNGWERLRGTKKDINWKWMNRIRLMLIILGIAGIIVFSVFIRLKLVEKIGWLGWFW